MGSAALRPGAGSYNAGAGLVGGTTVEGITSDNSDASYLTFSQASGDVGAYLYMGDLSLPAGTQFRSVTPRIRFATNASSMRILLEIRTGEDYGIENLFGTLTVNDIIDKSGATRTARPNGTPLRQEDVNSMILTVIGWYETNNNRRVHEAYLDVVYNVPPVVTVTGPTEGSTIQTTAPPVTWTYSDGDGDSQERYQVKIFSAAQYGAAGFDPETSTPTWSSGEVFSGSTSVTVGTNLVQGTTYRAYVKAADSGSGGRYGAWDSNTFTVQAAVGGSAAVPALGPSPVIMGTIFDEPSARTIYTIQPADNMLTYNQSSLETDTFGWAIRIAADVASITRSTAVTPMHGTASLAMTLNKPSTDATLYEGQVTTPEATAGIPVVAGRVYSASAWVRSPVARNRRAIIGWFTAAGALIQYDAGPLKQATTLNAFERLWATFTAPATAAFASVIVGVQYVGTDVNEIHYVDQIMFCPGKYNLALNPSMGRMGSSAPLGYTDSVSSGVTRVASIESTRMLQGIGAFRYAISALTSPNQVAGFTGIAASQRFPVFPSTTYTVSMWVYVESMSGGSTRFRIDFTPYTDNTVISGGPVNYVTVTKEMVGKWTRVSASYTTTAATNQLGVNFRISGGPELTNAIPTAITYLIDSFQIEEGSVATDFIDSSFTPGGYVAGPNAISQDDATLESSIGNWLARNNCSVARSTTQKFEGAASLAITANNLDARAGLNYNTAPAAFNGQIWSATCQFLPTGTARRARLEIRRLNSAKASLGTTIGPWFDTSLAGWTRLFMTAKVPDANTVFMTLEIVVEGTVAGEVHYADRFQLCRGISDLWIPPTETRRRWLAYDRDYKTALRPALPALDDNLDQNPITLYGYEDVPNRQTVHRLKTLAVV